MKKSLILVAMSLIALSGCTTTQQFKGPNGETVIQTDCNGWARSIATCFEEISKQCPNGYNVIDSREVQGQAVYVDPDTGVATPFPTVGRSVMASCK